MHAISTNENFSAHQDELIGEFSSQDLVHFFFGRCMIMLMGTSAKLWTEVNT